MGRRRQARRRFAAPAEYKGACVCSGNQDRHNSHRRQRSDHGGRHTRAFCGEGELHFAQGGIHSPGHLQQPEARSKLVFMIEAVFDPKTAENLHPGQPVDVEFGF